MSNQPDQYDEFRQFILNADPRSLIQQLNSDIKSPLVSAQNIANMLAMMQTPTATIQKKIDSGELNATEMLQQMTTLITQVFDVIDFYRETLNNQE
jgi:hypothetical protein